MSSEYARVSSYEPDDIEMSTVKEKQSDLNASMANTMNQTAMTIDFQYNHNKQELDDEGDEEDELRLSEGEWHLVPNLDSFFTKVYQYFHQRGYWNILVSRLLNTLTILFIIVFTTFLFIWIDWYSLYHCDKQECMSVHRFRDDPLSDLSRFDVAVLVVECVFSAYLCFVVFKGLYDLREMWEIKYFYNNDLEISEVDIQTITWSEVVEQLVRLQGRKRLSIVKKHLSAHDIVNRIMRRENYLIAFINKDILDISVPLPFLRDRKILTKTLEWNLRYIITYMFDDHLSIRDSFLNDPNKLYRTFMWLGFLNFIAAPFLSIFLLVFFFFKYTAIFREKPSSLGLRKWSPLAMWKFREFNELPHLFKKRIDESYKHATRYTEQFPIYLVSSIGRFVMFVASSFAAVIIVISLLKYPVMLYTEFFGQNLLWWLGILTIVIATSKSMVIEEHAVFDPTASAKKVAEYTHYMPKHWRNKAHHKEVREEFEGLFPYQLRLFVEEMCSVILTPLILWFSLPKSTNELIDFVRQITVEVEGVGNVCGFASFNFPKHGNPKFGSPNDAGACKSAQGKMEKSFVNFVANYPAWTPPENLGGSALITKLNINSYNAPLNNNLNNNLNNSIGSPTAGGTDFLAASSATPLASSSTTATAAGRGGFYASGGSGVFTGGSDESASARMFRLLETYYESHELSNSTSPSTSRDSNSKAAVRGRGKPNSQNRTPK